jgi:hypothetical protein
VLAVEFVAVGVAAIGDQRDVAGNVRVGRAGRHARDIVREPLRIARVNGVSLSGSDRKRREERCIDERQEADSPAVFHIDLVESLAGDAERGQFGGGHPDFG